MQLVAEIRVFGTVQGVGFRPTVYRIAKLYNLLGEVSNDGKGVVIRVGGNREKIAEFVKRLQEECPPLAKIDQLIQTEYNGEFNFNDFIISPSINSVVKTQITPDAATCPKCQEDIFNPLTRWYRYPFTNCTHCGPRLSIIRTVPYDRNNTSMENFTMCSECIKEYKNVENRRFHAQPIACHQCGPQVWLENNHGEPINLEKLDSLDAIGTLLEKGEIIAIKGIGGIHLAVDATNEITVQKLRSRKHRYDKPFALMARDIQIVQEYCIVNDLEIQLLTSPPAPIVLLNQKTRADKKEQLASKKTIALSVAPGQKNLGFMLPYTPLHHLILKEIDFPIILTSGNLSDEPQCIDNREATEKLGKIADYFLLHNRQIINRVDDSVVRVIAGKLQTLRRARGYAPAPINLPQEFGTVPHILALGGELKNTFCLLRDGKAILSQHLGDLSKHTAFQAYQHTLNLYLNLFDHKPQAIAMDLHPEYLSTKLGKELAAINGIPIYNIQHHHAHIGACLAENGISLNAPPVLGIALDGLGYGEDGTIWGGEFLLADYRQFKRLATFKPVAMIGGEKAIYQPWRNTYAQLLSAFNWEDLNRDYGNLELLEFLNQKPRSLLNQALEKNINSPLASSCGRLFDAVAAAIGICRDNCNYEGQAAMELEALIEEDILNNHKEIAGYPFTNGNLNDINYIETRPMWLALLEDLQQNISASTIAAKFHYGLADAITEMVKQLRIDNIINQVVLTGGVFQNCILLEAVSHRLQAQGMTVLTHSLIPANDGGLSLGQAVITAARLMN